MGVEYRHFLVPRDRTFRPAPPQLARLVERLVADRWLPRDPPALRIDGAEAAPWPLDVRAFTALAARDVSARWDVDDIHALRYPFATPLVEDEGYYRLRLDLGVDLHHHAGELVDPVDRVCACGASLEHARDHTFVRLRARCPACGAGFDPSATPVEIRDWNGEAHVLLGGGAYRFGLVVDVGKCIPPPPPVLHADLVRLVGDVLGVEVVDFGDIY